MAFIVVLGPNEPYDLITMAMTRNSMLGHFTFAPEWMHDHARVAEVLKNCDRVVDVILDEKEDSDTAINVKEALRIGKPVTRFYYASNAFDRKKMKTIPLKYIRSEVVRNEKE